MDIALKKLALVERLLSIWDEAALLRVAKVIEKEASLEDDDLTDAEYEAIQRELDQCDRGVLKFHSREESMRMIRKGPRG